MNRQQYNQLIINQLQSAVSKYPDIRFKQLLIDLNILKDSHNDFNEESRTTYSKLEKSSEDNPKKAIFNCICGSLEHLVSIQVEEDLVMCTIHLAPLSFKQRLIHGIKYIFGYRCKYGDWDEFFFKSADADTLQQFVNILRK